MTPLALVIRSQMSDVTEETAPPVLVETTSVLAAPPHVVLEKAAVAAVADRYCVQSCGGISREGRILPTSEHREPLDYITSAS